MAQHIHTAIEILDQRFARHRAAAAAWAEVRREVIHARGTLAAIEKGLKAPDRTVETVELMAIFARAALNGIVDDVITAANTNVA
jgi:hypothetical protein